MSIDTISNRNLFHRLSDTWQAIAKACTGAIRLVTAALGYALGFLCGILVSLVLWVVASVVAGYQAGRLR